MREWVASIVVELPAYTFDSANNESTAVLELLVGTVNKKRSKSSGEPYSRKMNDREKAQASASREALMKVGLI